MIDYCINVDFSMDVGAKKHETRLKGAGRVRQCSEVSRWITKYEFDHTNRVPNSVEAALINWS